MNKIKTVFYETNIKLLSIFLKLINFQYRVWTSLEFPEIKKTVHIAQYVPVHALTTKFKPPRFWKIRFILLRLGSGGVVPFSVSLLKPKNTITMYMKRSF